MNVLRVIGSMDPSSGGPCQGIRNSIPELEKMGVYNEVVSLDEPTSSFLGSDTFPVHALGAGKGPWNYSANLVPWLLENFSRFDVVLVHGLWIYHSYAVKKALVQYKRQQKHVAVPRFYVMPHGMLDPYFQRASGRKLKAIRNWLYWKLVEGNVVNSADGVLFTCEAELQLAREPFHPYHPKKEINVGYGIKKPPMFTQAMQDAFLEKCADLKHEHYILFLSRIHEKKGVDLLVKAYAELLGQWEKTKARQVFVSASADEQEPEHETLDFPKLVIAGPGLDTPYGERILEMVSETKQLQKAIYFPGMLEGNAKWGAFYGCDAFVLPSHQENFGIAVVEALACGKPVLITNQVNIWREINASEAGVVSDDTFSGVHSLLERWLHLDCVTRLAMSKKAQEAYENHYAIGPAASKLLKALSEKNNENGAA